jgi:hypothetical protein
VIQPKPPLPNVLVNHWQRITINPSDPDTAWVIRLATSAAHGWLISPHGPLRDEGMTLAEIASGAVHEALLHLLELGLIGIDTDRLHAAGGFPLHREHPKEPTP